MKSGGVRFARSKTWTRYDIHRTGPRHCLGVLLGGVGEPTPKERPGPTPHGGIVRPCLSIAR